MEDINSQNQTQTSKPWVDFLANSQNFTKKEAEKPKKHVFTDTDREVSKLKRSKTAREKLKDEIIRELSSMNSGISIQEVESKCREWFNRTVEQRKGIRKSIEELKEAFEEFTQEQLKYNKETDEYIEELQKEVFEDD